MTYISWAALYEGAHDSEYFNILIPKLMEEIVIEERVRDADIPLDPVAIFGRNGREIDSVTREICENKNSIHIVFIHADTGGRGLEENIKSRSQVYVDRAKELCGFNEDRCVLLLPRHETEAWALSDPAALASALGYRGNMATLGAPASAAQAEANPDPKQTLVSIVESAQRGRRADIRRILPSIAQYQSIEALRGSRSFRDFDMRLRLALKSLGFAR